MSDLMIRPAESMPSELSIEDIQGQVAKIQKLMGAVMRSGEHYGIIPGTNKPSLLKPGAEKLGFVFRHLPKYDVQKIDLPNGHREYIVTTTLQKPDGSFVAQGVGSCSTMESKYRYRNAAKKCPHCGKETIIKGKDEYGGGWICYAKKGGCGAKFADNAPEITSQPTGKVENPDIADTYNTVLKIAKKRSHVDSEITACAASDIFTQDVEDSQPDEAVPVAHEEVTPLQRARDAARKAGNATVDSGLFTDEEQTAMRKLYTDNKDNIPSLEHLAKKWMEDIDARRADLEGASGAFDANA
jgi:hypothetical protein